MKQLLDKQAKKPVFFYHMVNDQRMVHTMDALIQKNACACPFMGSCTSKSGRTYRNLHPRLHLLEITVFVN